MRLENWGDFSKITGTGPVLLTPEPSFSLLGPKTKTHQLLGNLVFPCSAQHSQTGGRRAGDEWKERVNVKPVG